MSNARYISHTKILSFDISRLRNDIEDALVAGVQRVHRHPTSNSGVYVGGGGILLMDWRLSDFSGQLPETQKSIDVTTLPLSRPDSGGRVSFLETSVGAAVLTLTFYLRNPSARDTHRQDTCARLIRDAVQVAISENVDDDGCEVLYGRAGLLYALLFLRAEAQSLVANEQMSEKQLNEDGLVRVLCHLFSDKNIHTLVDDIVERGKVGGHAYKEELQLKERANGPPLMWSWHGKRYIGGAHGVVGILQMLVSTPSDIVAPYWDLITSTVQWILSIQQPCGNWPHKAGYTMHLNETVNEADQLVQWCHGAPGVLILLSTLLKHFGSLAPRHSANLTLPQHLEASVHSALARGGKLVYERGLLRKGVGLCHGVGGSVYALLAVSDVLDSHTDVADRTWLLRAAHLAQLAASYEQMTRRGEMSIPDRPYSLYEGVAGMCCAWAEVLRRIEGRSGAGRGMPGYDDLFSPNTTIPAPQV